MNKIKEKIDSRLISVKITDELKEQIQIKVQGQNSNSFKSYKWQYILAPIACVVVLALFIFNFSWLKDTNQTLIPPKPGSNSLVPKTVNYSSLVFANTEEVKSPFKLSANLMCIIAFSEKMVAHSALVIKGTVQNIRYKEYKYLERNDKFNKGDTIEMIQQYAVYDILIDKVYYSNQTEYFRK